MCSIFNNVVRKTVIRKTVTDKNKLVSTNGISK